MAEGLSPAQKEQLAVVTGDTHPQLAINIAGEMGVELMPVELRFHADTEPYVRYEESVRGKHVIVVQTHGAVDGRSVSDSLHQQLALIDAARLSSAASITALSPNLAGARQDRKSKPRESVLAGLNLRMMRLAGANDLVTMDVHSPATLTAFNGPAENLTAQPLLREELQELITQDPADSVVVSPDVGHSKDAQRHAARLGLGVVHMIKERDPKDPTRIIRPEKVDGVEGKTCFMIDDMIDTFGTLDSAAYVLRESGAVAIYAAATHGIFSGPGLERAQGSSIDRIYVTDTLPQALARNALQDRLRVVSVAPKIAQSLEHMISGGSVSEIFEGQNYA
jgi:ribose-phosphate pyrophosphokinase